MITTRRNAGRRAALGIALVAVLLTACGAVGANTAAVGKPLQAMRPYGGDPATEGTPRSGGTLLIGNDREIVSFDPTVQNGNAAATAVYDLLLKMTPDGKAEPYLARSMATTDDGRTWRMGLRPGVRFSDGTPRDANAVIVNTQRHIDRPASPAGAYARQIQQMRAVDPLTVEFTLKAPLGDFPVVFAQPLFAGTLGMIISPAALQQYGDDVGNTPWAPDRSRSRTGCATTSSSSYATTGTGSRAFRAWKDSSSVRCRTPRRAMRRWSTGTST